MLLPGAGAVPWAGPSCVGPVAVTWTDLLPASAFNNILSNLGYVLLGLLFLLITLQREISCNRALVHNDMQALVSATPRACPAPWSPGSAAPVGQGVPERRGGGPARAEAWAIAIPCDASWDGQDCALGWGRAGPGCCMGSSSGGCPGEAATWCPLPELGVGLTQARCLLAKSVCLRQACPSSPPRSVASPSTSACSTPWARRS